MGVIYSKNDSMEFINTIQSNLKSANEVIEDLMTGSHNLIAAINGKTLSGAAYNAGKGLFQELILPTINRCGQAMEEIQQDLGTYRSANSEIQDASTETLDEDKLIQKIQESENYRNVSKMTASALGSQAFDLLGMTNPVTAVVSLANHLFGVQDKLNSYVESLDKDIEKMKKDLRLLQNFVSQTQGLFHNSLNNFKLAMQAVTALESITVKSNGMYSFPEGIDKSWFMKIQDSDKINNFKKKQQDEAIKYISDLYKKNPSAAIEQIKNNDKLYAYILEGINHVPSGLKDAVLTIFALQEKWATLPKKLAQNILNSPEFALKIYQLSEKQQAIILSSLGVLSDKGWDVLAPIGYASRILSKSSTGLKMIESSKVGLAVFKKLDKVKVFLKANPVLKEGLSYAGDGLSFTAFAYEEYTNPESPAYGDVSKAIYGGINKFFIQAGPLEGVQYGGPVGAAAGFINYFAQGGGMKDIAIFNTVPIIKKLNFPKIVDKDKWLKEQYKEYDRREKELSEGNFSSYKVPNSEYKPGIQTPGGNPSFNPNTGK